MRHCGEGRELGFESGVFRCRGGELGLRGGVDVDDRARGRRGRRLRDLVAQAEDLVAEARLKVAELQAQLSEHNLQMVKVAADKESAAARARTQAALDKLAAALPNALVCNGRVYGGTAVVKSLAEARELQRDKRIAALEAQIEALELQPEVAQGVPVADDAAQMAGVVEGVLV